jgi:hypothetical protein
VNFSAAAPAVPALTSAALRPPVDELRSYAAGVMAHIAIQSMYRIQHAGNFIITERAVWVGDSRASTISTVLDQIDKLMDLAKDAAQVKSPGARTGATGAASENLWVALAYLLDISTAEGSAVRLVRKRYDIVDFGPMTLNPVSQVRFGEAYEIKSKKGVRDGREYIGRQTGNYNATLEKLKGALEETLNISGLGGYRLRPGRAWPPYPQLVLVGPNVLMFWLQEPGVVAYEWLSFKRMSLKRMRELVRRVQKETRKLFEVDTSPSVLIMVLVAAVALIGVTGLIVATRGGAARALTPVLARLAQAGAVGVATSAAAAPGGGAIDDASGADGVGVGEILAAFEKAELDFDVAGTRYRPPASAGEGLAGGTAETPYEQALNRMVDVLVAETMFVYSVHVGQGTELPSDAELAIVKSRLAGWIGAFIDMYGPDRFLTITGRSYSAELDEATAIDIAQLIVAMARDNIESTLYGHFLGHFFSLATQDVDESLPRGYDDDGEG